MIALNELLPDTPAEKDSVNQVLATRPYLGGLITRLATKIYASFPDAEITMSTRQYDDWDPPLTITVYVPLADHSKYLDVAHEIRDWARNDAEFNPLDMFVSVRSKSVG